MLHKRLAARNVLLNAELEPKISGFGPEPPQPQNNERDGDTEDKVCFPLSKPYNIILQGNIEKENDTIDESGMRH